MDFTISKYKEFLSSLISAGYSVSTYSEFLDSPSRRKAILRHDVDKLPENSLRFAKIQADFGVKGTYYFRRVPESWNEDIIKEIASIGHEIGYHYEDMSFASQIDGRIKDEKELASKAIISFEKNLAELRNLAKVNTICMHGSPLSKWDSRLLWKYYNYKNLNIIGEPYFDTDFTKVLYLTDTGRKWDGDSVNVRDKATFKLQGETALKASERIRSTDDIIKLLNDKKLPEMVMFTFHPQRWSNNPFRWFLELVLQNIKNLIKYVLIKLRT